MGLYLHTVHVPPGSSNGWVKVEVLEAIYAGLARLHESPQVLCGDFNTPQLELPSGEVVTWAQRMTETGPRLRGRFRGGDGARWDAAERRVLVGLSDFGLVDVFRYMHGYEREAASWVHMRKGRESPRRFDHVFTSKELTTRSCEYLDGPRQQGLSDHAPLEVEFVPRLDFFEADHSATRKAIEGSHRSQGDQRA